MLEIKVNENVACIERGDTDPETTLTELLVACRGVIEAISAEDGKNCNETLKFFSNMLKSGCYNE